MNWWDVLNPFTYLGDAAGKIVADAWTVAMLGIWNAGLWLLKLVLTIEDAFLTPDLSQNGPGGQVYPYTFWLAGALVVIILFVQPAIPVFRRHGPARRPKCPRSRGAPASLGGGARRAGGCSTKGCTRHAPTSSMPTCASSR